MKNLRALDFEQVRVAAEKAVIYYGCCEISARLVFHGSRMAPLDPGVLTSMAALLTTGDPPLAASIFYYLFTKKDSIPEPQAGLFACYFTSAMHSWGLGRLREPDHPVILGDISKPDGWKFDVEALERTAAANSAAFKTLEELVLAAGTVVGTRCGMAARNSSEGPAGLLPENALLTDEYESWLDSWPAEMDTLLA